MMAPAIVLLAELSTINIVGSYVSVHRAKTISVVSHIRTWRLPRGIRHTYSYAICILLLFHAPMVLPLCTIACELPYDNPHRQRHTSRSLPRV